MGKRDWTREELILALDLYMTNRRKPPSKQSQEVAELSKLLNALRSSGEPSNSLTYRNVNGVYMKMMNFRRWDPEFTGSGKVGLPNGNSDEEPVWKEFAHDRDRLSAVARAITSAVSSSVVLESVKLSHDDFADAPEGRLLSRLHLVRERSRKLVERRRTERLESSGKLDCEACGFDFFERYGERGRGFIEVHHLVPLHLATEDARTRLEDLALLCSNCHRMIHSRRPWLTLDQLKSLVGESRR